MQRLGHRAGVRQGNPEVAPAGVAVRGRTRENAVSVQRLQALGITAQSWADDIRSGALPGQVTLDANGALAGYCFGARDSGEIVVLALLPAFEGQGLGRQLLARMVQQLASLLPACCSTLRNACSCCIRGTARHTHFATRPCY